MRRPFVCLDAGHGGVDSGASRNPFTEKELALAVVRKMECVLHDHQTPTVLTRNHDVFVTLGERARIANVKNADIFVSIHLNADPDGDGPGTHEATGFEVWYRGGSEKGQSLAEVLLERLRTCLPESRGTRSSDHLYVLKHTKMPAVLVELGFVDSRHDATILSNPKKQDQLALALSQGILDWWESHSPRSTSPSA